jgi:hypothetical protein
LTEVEKTGERRRLVFSNIANGVPLTSVMAVFKMSELEVTNDLKFVLRKIMEYRYAMTVNGGSKTSPFVAPIIPADSHADILVHGKSMLVTLTKLGNQTLGSDIFIYKPIKSQKLDHPSVIGEMSHRVNRA